MERTTSILIALILVVVFGINVVNRAGRFWIVTATIVGAAALVGIAVVVGVAPRNKTTLTVYTILIIAALLASAVNWLSTQHSSGSGTL